MVLANIIAWPVAYVFMDNWLQNFAVRIDQSLLNFLFSAATVLVIAVLTVSILSAKAAAASPIKALRHEQ